MRLWGRKKRFTRIPIDQLQPGMHVSLAERWLDHPFLLNEFTLESDHQIDLIRALGMTDVLWCEAHSTAPPKVEPPVADASALERAQAAEQLARARREREERQRRTRAARERTGRAEKAYAQAAAELRAAFAIADRQPDQAVARAVAVVDAAVATFATESDVGLVLLSETMAANNLHTHGINVMLLSLLQGNAHRMSQADLRDMALGALFHDVGRMRLPDTIRRAEEADLSRSELNFMRMHPEMGTKMILGVGELGAGARAAIALHHEHWDGTGYPYRLAGEKIPLPARLVAIADRYDELANPLRVQDALTPHQALVRMYTAESGRFEPAALQHFIKTMGVYPPGTLVELSNGAVGLVVSVNRNCAVRPTVMLWHEGAKDEAPALDLSVETEVSILRAVRPIELEPAVRDYLNPRTRAAYFYARAAEPA